MANKNLFKKVAPVILSATVAFSGMPATAFAAEFADSEVAVEAEATEDTEETDVDVADEEVSEDVDVEEAEEDTEDAGETSEEDLFTAEAAEETFTDDAGDALTGEYQYVYAGLTWSQYWAAEGVYKAGDTTSSSVKDRKGEYDKGAFDTVTRATANHGLHRGSFQTMTTIYGESGAAYQLAGWQDRNTMILADGTTASFANGAVNGDAIDHYEVYGLKYVPVKVKTADYDAFKKAYNVVENGGTLFGGFGEVSLSAYTATAAVTENTNGLKEAVKNADGSFSFKGRTNGTDSGLKDTALKTADGINVEVKEANGSYGEFLRVDLLGNYGGLGAAMQAVEWTYYGKDSTYSTPLATYGTKFASDNWMHKSMGIQLGLTKSVRCQLPDGYDGTGYWAVKVIALGYNDFTFTFQATDANIVGAVEGNLDTAKFEGAVAQAKALNESDYSTDSWYTLQNELKECEDMLENIDEQTQAGIDEQITHLKDAMENLVPAAVTLSAKSGTLKLGASVTLKATANVSGTIVWSTSNAKVATVNNGVVKAVAPGTAKITATLGSKTATYTVTVAQPVRLNKATATLYVKGSPASVTLKATKDVKGTVKFKSSNTKVATVNSKGVVTAKKAGTVTITATVGSYKATCKVTVKNPGISAKASAGTIYVGKTTTVKVTKNGVSGTAKYTSSNKKVATVSSKGVVTGKKAGTAKITVKVGKYSKTVTVKVKAGTLKLAKSSASIKKGQTTTIKATATPSGKVTYKSSNKKVATVSSKGVVKGIKKGTAKITVTCNGTSKTFKVTVK